MDIFSRLREEILSEREEKFVVIETAAELRSRIFEMGHYAAGSVNRMWCPKTKKYYGLPHMKCTDADIVRRYLGMKLAEVGRSKMGGLGTNSQDAWFPMYVPETLPLFLETAGYIDIRSCFYTIYSMFGTDCACELTISATKHIDLKFFAAGIMRGNIWHEICQEKKLRNMVYGLSRGGRFLVHKGGSFFYVENPRNALKNNSLHNLILFITHSIVSEILPYLFYWNIDGGFCAPEKLPEIHAVIESYGLEARSQIVTELEIRGLGLYTSMEKSSLRVGNGKGVNNVFGTNIADQKRIKNFIEKYLTK